MPEHSEIMRFRVHPAPFGTADSAQFVAHAVAVVRELSRRLPLELVRHLECSFSVLKVPSPARPVIDISISVEKDQIAFATSSYQSVMGAKSLRELPDVEQFAEQLCEYIRQSLEGWLDSMAKTRRLFFLRVLDSRNPAAQ